MKGWLSRQHTRLAARQRRQLDWTARHHLLIVVVSALGLALIVAFGRQ